MFVIQKLVAEPSACSYLSGRQSTMEYICASSLTGKEYEDCMNRGYRKFGNILFRPVCGGCQECRPIRVPAALFTPNRSQRRAWKRNQDLRVEVDVPIADDAHVNLYNRYHQAQSRRKGWKDNDLDVDEYDTNFLQSTVPNVEIGMWQGPALLAVLLAEITPNVVSAIYHYHDLDLAERGLGTFCVMHAIELARRLQKSWVYFGFYVAQCRSLAYKAAFKPSEIMNADGIWHEQR